MDEAAPNLEMIVLRTIQGAFKSREVLEAEAPADALPLDDDRILLHHWAAMVDRQGTMLAHLAILPSTKADLLGRMPGMVNRSPAWLEARINSEPMNWRLFLTGLAQTAGTHRTAIEQVMDEQMAEPEETEQVLDEAPIPTDGLNEDRSALMKGVLDALLAHTQALLNIARDLETQLHRWVEEGGDVPPAVAARYFGVEEDDEDEDEDEEIPFDPDAKYQIAEGVDAEWLLQKLDELDEEEERKIEEKERRKLEREDDVED